MVYTKKVIINGKRLSMNKINIIIGESVDNIILSGFNSVSELEKIVSVNGRNNDYLIDCILFKLQITYAEIINRDAGKAIRDKTAAINVGLMIDTYIIILELIHRRLNNFICNYDKKSTKKVEEDKSNNRFRYLKTDDPKRIKLFKQMLKDTEIIDTTGSEENNENVGVILEDSE